METLHTPESLESTSGFQATSVNNQSFQCSECTCTYAYKYTLYRHQRVAHNLTSKTTNCKIKCPLCNEFVNSQKGLVVHLHMIHSIIIAKESHHFAAYEDFLKWKNSMEAETKSQYTKRSGTKTLVGSRKIGMFLCNRQGYYKDSLASDRKHKLKSQGTSRIDGACPSFLEIEEKEEQFTVNFYKDHLGHEKQMCHITLSLEERENIAHQIKEGIPFDIILDKIRDNTSPENYQRIHLLTNKDIHNIKTNFHLRKEQQHSNDAISLAIWVEKMAHLDNSMNPILCYKPQNSLDPKQILGEKDFCLAIMTPFQRIMMKEFAPLCICIDSTHSTNAYNFVLTTLLTIDEFGNGMPIAFCFSNRRDEPAWNLFFGAIRENLKGQIKTKIFMSDDDSSYYNSWLNIMGPAEKKLLCLWHLDKNWRLNVNNKIQNQNKRTLVYKRLCVLLEESNENNFKHNLEIFIRDLENDDDTKSFGRYFVGKYGNRTESWAHCYRLGIGFNTNNHLESLHRTIKYVYMNGIEKQRMDRCVNSVIKLTKNKLFDRIIKLEKNKPHLRHKEIQLAHFKSKDINPTRVVNIIENKVWEVQSSRNNSSYLVNQLENHCNAACKFKCNECNVCIHMYECTCPENTLKANLCKHIHAICQQVTTQVNEPFEQQTQGPTNLSTNIQVLVNQASTSNVVQHTIDAKTFDLHQRGRNLCQIILNSNYAHLTESEYNKAKMALDRLAQELNTNNILPDSSRDSSTKRFEPQSLYSTSKKRKTNEFQLQKPSEAEKLIIKSSIEEDENVLNVHSEFDHNYSINAL